MTRPLRIEFPGALYHVESRGHRNEPIYEDDTDRETFLEILAEAVERFSWRCYAYCLMTNHYHLLIETPQANLSAGMRFVNGVYTQSSNRRHRRVGHIFQGRYSAILVDPDNYLLAVARHIVLNPVRAGTVKIPGAWSWSSYRATCGDELVPDWLAADKLLQNFDSDRREAQKRYYVFVLNGMREKGIWHKVRQQLYLGEDDFIRNVQTFLKNPDDPNISRIQKRPPVPSLDDIAENALTRNEAMERAYRTGGYSYSEIARYFEIHPSTVSRIIRDRVVQRSGPRESADFERRSAAD